MKPKVRARYKVVGPRVVKRVVNKASIDKETKSLQQESVTIEEKMWMVYFPQGHSIRVNEAELMRLGFNIKPRLVDMNTGEVMDFGGDPYDLGEEIPDQDVTLMDDPELDDPFANNPAPKVAKVKAE